LHKVPVILEMVEFVELFIDVNDICRGVLAFDSIYDLVEEVTLPYPPQPDDDFDNILFDKGLDFFQVVRSWNVILHFELKSFSQKNSLISELF
jgi:hypothetical protein